MFLGVGLTSPVLQNDTLSIFIDFIVQLKIWLLQSHRAAMAQVSKDLADALNLLRPICPRWGTFKGCKHSQKCKFSHPGDDRLDRRDFSASELPYVARHVDKDNNEHLVARPPVAEAWGLYWSCHGKRTLFFFKLVVLINGVAGK